MICRTKQKKKAARNTLLFVSKKECRIKSAVKDLRWLVLFWGVSVCLVLGSCQNEAEFLEMDRNNSSDIVTRNGRAAGDVAITPSSVKLDKKTGGKVTVSTQGSALVQLIGLRPEYNIDTTIIPSIVGTGETDIAIKWNSAGAPNQEFTFIISVTPDSGIAAVAVMTYDPSLVPGVGRITISPEGDIPDEGGTYSCTFQNATYAGNILFQAIKNGKITPGTTGTVADSLKVVISEAVSKGDVAFEISIDGGGTWTEIGKRKQIYNTLGVGRMEVVNLQNHDIPVGGSLVKQYFNGTLTAKIIVKASTIKEDLASGTGYVADGFIALLVPYNSTGANRNVYFGFSTDDGKTWKSLGSMTQLGK